MLIIGVNDVTSTVGPYIHRNRLESKSSFYNRKLFPRVGAVMSNCVMFYCHCRTLWESDKNLEEVEGETSKNFNRNVLQQTENTLRGRLLTIMAGEVEALII